MTGLSKVWLVLAVLFTVGNLAVPIIMPVVWREPMHLGIHLLLAAIGAYFGRHLLRGRDVHGGSRPEAAERSAARSELSGRLSRLEDSVDAVAIEVERIGEGQRFVTRVLTGADRVPAPGNGAAAPIVAEAAPPTIARS